MKNSMHTIPLGFCLIFSGVYFYYWQNMSAGILMVVLPIIIAFTLLQKYLVEGLTAGVVKG